MGSMSGKSSTNRIRSISVIAAQNAGVVCKVDQKPNDITQLWPCHHPSNTIGVWTYLSHTNKDKAFGYELTPFLSSATNNDPTRSD